MNKTQIQAEVDKFERNVKWKEHHSNKEHHDEKQEPATTKYTPPDIFKTTNTNLPTTKTPPLLQSCLSAIRSDIMGSTKTTIIRDNLTPDQRLAMKALIEAQRNGLIQIKPADKGGGTCVMDTPDYTKEMYSQLNAKLNDENFYILSSKQELKLQKQSIMKILEFGKGTDITSKSDFKQMQPNEKPGKMYGLPKVHKGIPEGQTIPPCRPIISNSGAQTEMISAFVDYHSKNQVKQLPSYVQDSPDILRIFQTENDNNKQIEGSFPVTVDVTALYTSIPADGEHGGIQAFEKALNQRKEEEINQTPTHFLITLLELVLHGNIFEFDDKLFRQQIGTAMGTRVAPTYACLFMGWLEEKILKTWKGTKPYLWRRYIDDIFFIWRGSQSELQTFIEHLNKAHPNIKFTSTYNQDTKTIPFLDMQITIDEDGIIQTDLYTKDTAKAEYLLPKSCHPGHITKNIPYAMGYRIRRLCSKEERCKLRLQELNADLTSRSYNNKITKNAFERVLKIDRREALKKVVSTKEEKTVFAITYHPALPSISQIVNKHWSVMKNENSRLQQCLENAPVIAYKRSKNLKDELIRAKVTTKRSSDRIKNGYQNCSQNRRYPCKLCIYNNIQGPIKEHKCHQTGKSYTINSPVNCQTKNVIYRITCKKHPKFVYIGETQRQFFKRAGEHRGYVNRNEINQPTGHHFNLPGHQTSDMTCIVIEQVLPANDPFLRKRREKFWINKYQSVEHGANTQG